MRSWIVAVAMVVASVGSARAGEAPPCTSTEASRVASKRLSLLGPACIDGWNGSAVDVGDAHAQAVIDATRP